MKGGHIPEVLWRFVWIGSQKFSLKAEKVFNVISNTNKAQSCDRLGRSVENNYVLFSPGCFHFVWAKMIGVDKTVFLHPLGNSLRSSQISVHAIADMKTSNTSIRYEQYIVSALCFSKIFS